MTHVSRPWWAEAGSALLAPHDLAAIPLSTLWDLSERLAHVRDQVELPLLALDFAAHGDLAALWASLRTRTADVAVAVGTARGVIAATLRSGALGADAFRRSWEDLGFVEHATRASTAADDHLEGLLEVPRIASDEARPAFGQVNLASRALRISQFLTAIAPGPADVLFDLGSGSGKFVTTVAASSRARVIGVELGASWVRSSRDTAARLGVANAEFICADVHDVDFSSGTVFYLYHPFYGQVAAHTAAALADLAAQKPIDVYLQGPMNGFAEHFAGKAFTSIERRGQISVLHSGPPRFTASGTSVTAARAPG